MKKKMLLPIVLWVFQVLLAVLFVQHGVMTLQMTPAQQAQHHPWFPASFLHFIAVMELLGGIGLILPSLLRIKPILTPIAACGLVVIMLGAAVVRLPQGVQALGPVIFGSMAAFVAYGRFRLKPIEGRPGRVG
jgi:putative oxidoreductase